jgi:polysaccharide pyruvyl transferase WcaK-like protein
MKNMKILILTQPLRNNYGGILQAYALQTVLKRMGHDAVTDSKPYINTSVIRRIAGVIKRIIFRYVLRKNINTSIFFPFFISTIQRTINLHTLRFVKENMATVDFFRGKSKPNRSGVKTYDAIVVGSDQVWRKLYSDVSAHLLDFTKGMNIKRIAYAASFGKDDLSEYTPKLIKHTAKLAKQFDAISVREDSGVSLCKKYWNVEAIHLLDPTLLLNRNDYIQLIEQDKRNISPVQGNLFIYILDRTAEKQQVVDKISSTLNLSAFEILPGNISILKNLKEKEKYEKYIFPPVTQWLQSFIDAEFIVTDSFHGTIFSIIFNKPFIVTGNEERGMARISSVLKIFGLENRLIYPPTELNNEIIYGKIDWNNINNIISDRRKDAINFISDNFYSINVNGILN